MSNEEHQNLERVRASMSSQGVPTLAELIKRFGNVPGELEISGEVPPKSVSEAGRKALKLKENP